MKEYDKNYEYLLTVDTRQIGYYIIEFYKVLIEIGNTEYINNFLENIKSLKVKKVSANNKKTGFFTAAQYFSDKNLIEYSEKYAFMIFHELFHLASCNYKKNKVGLKKVVDNHRAYGQGCNEGYTTLLTERYFHNEFISYLFLPEIFVTIENALGVKKMSSLYFNEDPDDFYDELEKYLSEEEVNTFIHNTDFLLNAMLKDFNTIFRRKKIYKALKDTCDIVFKFIIKKTEDEYVNNIITLEEASNIIDSIYDMDYNFIFKKEIFGLYMYKLYDFESLTSLINNTATKFKVPEEYIDDDYYFYKKKNGIHRVKKKEIKYIES